MRTKSLALVLSTLVALPVCAETASRSITIGGGGREGKSSTRYLPRHHRPDWVPLPEPHTFLFRMEVLADGGEAGSYGPGGESLLHVRPGQTYSIRLYNPLPVRAAVALTVDGLNTITGRPASSPSSGSKWMMEPNSSVDIAGWQTGESSARRFVFTSKRDSYARWRSRDFGEDLSRNCGVIGAAFFWNSAELEAALRPRPLTPYVYERSSARRSSPAGGAADFQAGTGMGERMRHPVQSVAFEYDAGMYDPSETLAIYYDFARGGIGYPGRPSGFAPEMGVPHHIGR